MSFEQVQAPAAPIDMLEQYFGAHGWASERNGDEEIFATVEGAWAHYQLRALWREEEQVLQFVGISDLQAPDEKRGAIYETLGLINEQLWIGHFEMWSVDGTILFRHATLVDGEEEGVLSFAQAEAMVEAAIDECDRYYPVFRFVIESDRPPAEALAAALTDTAGEA